MAFYLREFQTDAEYNAYITGSTAFHPNTSLIGGTDVKYEKVIPAGAVDLGLPSGTLWHKYNLGANSETEYGDYYMWGSTTPDTNNTCDWKHSPFNNSSSTYDAAYFNAHKSEWLDENDVLKPEYDAAHVQLGGDWHMPTSGQVQELIDNTNNEWVTDYQGSGINGRKFTSKTNGNSIFIPADGRRGDSSFYDVGSDAYLWSSMLNSSNPFCAFNLRFDSGDRRVNYNSRYYGFCVRPVQ